MRLFARGPRIAKPSKTDLNLDWYRINHFLATSQARTGKPEAEQTIADLLGAAQRALTSHRGDLRLRRFLNEIVVPTTEILRAELAVTDPQGAASVQRIIDSPDPRHGDVSFSLARYCAARHAAGLAAPDGGDAAQASLTFVQQLLRTAGEMRPYYAAKVSRDPVLQQLAKDPTVGPALTEMVSELIAAMSGDARVENRRAEHQPEAPQIVPTDGFPGF